MSVNTFSKRTEIDLRSIQLTPKSTFRLGLGEVWHIHRKSLKFSRTKVISTITKTLSHENAVGDMTKLCLELDIDLKCVYK